VHGLCAYGKLDGQSASTMNPPPLDPPLSLDDDLPPLLASSIRSPSILPPQQEISSE
jgi:hypothetical protein